jgi:hypothetical protein
MVSVAAASTKTAHTTLVEREPFRRAFFMDAIINELRRPLA